MGVGEQLLRLCFYVLNITTKATLQVRTKPVSLSATDAAYYHTLPEGKYTVSIQKFYKLLYRDCTDVPYKTVSRGLATMQIPKQYGYIQ
jgi:hypothetical protein